MLEDTARRRSSQKKYFDEFPTDACASPSSHGGQDRNDDLAPVSSPHSRRSAASSKKISPRLSLTAGRKSKPRNPGSQSLPKSIALKGISLQPTVVFDTFWRFAAERKAVDDRRRAGLPQS